MLAARIGQELQITNVAAETGVALKTAREWLSIAEASGVVALLPPFHENIGKTVVKKPKLYFTDTGFAAWLCDLPSPEALHRYSQQREIDLLIKTGNTYHPTGIKTTSHPEASMVKAFDRIRSGTFQRGCGALICMTDEMRFLTADVVALSVLDIRPHDRKSGRRYGKARDPRMESRASLHSGASCGNVVGPPGLEPRSDP